MARKSLNLKDTSTEETQIKDVMQEEVPVEKLLEGGDSEAEEVAMTSPAPVLPEEEEKKSTEEEIKEVVISGAKKTPFRIKGTNNIIYLNVSDMGLYSRLKVGYDRLIKMMEEIAEIGSKIDDISVEESAKLLDEYDAKMRVEVDTIFNSQVADACCDDGTMWDPYQGMFRFEHIIDSLCGLYENNMSTEFMRMRSRVNSKVSQYRRKPASSKKRR